KVMYLRAQQRQLEMGIPSVLGTQRALKLKPGQGHAASFQRDRSSSIVRKRGQWIQARRLTRRRQGGGRILVQAGERHVELAARKVRKGQRQQRCQPRHGAREEPESSHALKLH